MPQANEPAYFDSSIYYLVPDGPMPGRECCPWKFYVYPEQVLDSVGLIKWLSWIDSSSTSARALWFLRKPDRSSGGSDSEALAARLNSKRRAASTWRQRLSEIVAHAES